MYLQRVSLFPSRVALGRYLLACAVSFLQDPRLGDSFFTHPPSSIFSAGSLWPDSETDLEWPHSSCPQGPRMFLEPQTLPATGLEGSLNPTSLCCRGASWGAERRGELPVVFRLLSSSVRTELRSLPPARCCWFCNCGSQRVFSHETGAQADGLKLSPAKSNIGGLSPIYRKNRLRD